MSGHAAAAVQGLEVTGESGAQLGQEGASLTRHVVEIIGRARKHAGSATSKISDAWTRAQGEGEPHIRLEQARGLLRDAEVDLRSAGECLASLERDPEVGGEPEAPQSEEWEPPTVGSIQEADEELALEATVLCTDLLAVTRLVVGQVRRALSTEPPAEVPQGSAESITLLLELAERSKRLASTPALITGRRQMKEAAMLLLLKYPGLTVSEATSFAAELKSLPDVPVAA